MENCIRSIREKNGITRLVLSNPSTKNALTKDMVNELIRHLEVLQWETSEKLRLLVLEAEGAFFCCGANIQGVEEAGDLPGDENIREAFVLSRLFREFAALPFPTMAVVRGGALSEALGLLASMDYVAAGESAIFGTPEVRTGLLPAVAAPYLARKIGLSRLSSMSLLGRTFGAKEAFETGLVHLVAPDGSLESVSRTIENDLLSCGPESLRKMKHLLLKISPLPENEIEEFAAMQIAEARSSGEGREGLAALRENRSPRWVLIKG